jgi:hypothetical protein
LASDHGSSGGLSRLQHSSITNVDVENKHFLYTRNGSSNTDEKFFKNKIITEHQNTTEEQSYNIMITETKINKANINNTHSFLPNLSKHFIEADISRNHYIRETIQ